MSKIFTHPVYRIFIALFCCALWGSAFPTLKISYRELNLLSHDVGSLLIFAGCRFLLASLLLLTLNRIVKGRQEGNRFPGRRNFFIFLAIGLLQTSGQYLFFYTGLVRTPGTISAVVNSSGVFFTVILAHLFFADDRITWQKMSGIVMGIAGIIVVNGGVADSHGFLSSGVLLLLGAALSGAAGGILVKKISLNRSPLTITAWQMFLGSLLLIAVGFLFPSHSDITITNKAVVLFFYSAFLSATAFVLWNYLLKYNKAGEIGFYKFAIPLFGTLFSFAFLNESLSIGLFIPLILVSSGILLVTLNSSSH